MPKIEDDSIKINENIQNKFKKLKSSLFNTKKMPTLDK